MEEQSDLERLQAALEELLAVTTEGRLATIFQVLTGAIILEGSDTVQAALVEMATYLARDGMATIVIARDMAPSAPLGGHVTPLPFTYQELPSEEHRALLGALRPPAYTEDDDDAPAVEVGHGETPLEGRNNQP
jgi:hypothetical protein